MEQEKSRLNVAFVFDDSLDSSDGVAQIVKSLGRWLSGRGHRVSYLVGESQTRQWAGGPVYSLAKNVRVSFNKNHLSIPLPASSRKIKKLLRQENFDVLHVQAPYSPFMAGKVIGRASDKTAVVGTFHILPADFYARFGTRLLGWWCAETNRRFDEFLSVSLPAAEFAKKYYGLDSSVLPNAVEVERFRVKPAEHDGKQIVFLGRLVERKGCLELLKAFRLACGQGLDAKLVVAGDGPQRKNLEKFVSKHDLGDKVEFLGYIQEEDKPLLLSRADIACFPSIGGESFGIVLIEAMAAGAKAVLGGDNPGYRSVLSGRPELLVNPKNTAEFAGRLVDLLSDKTALSNISRWLAEEVKKYDIENVGRQLEQEYLSAIAKRSPTMHNESQA